MPADPDRFQPVRGIAGPTSRATFTTPDGALLSYAVWDGPADRTVLLLHGGMACALDWWQVAAELRDDWTVVALDQRGCGESAWEPEARYGIEPFADDAAHLISLLRLEPVALVGHSLGAGAACLLAARRPELVSKLVLEDGGPRDGVPRPPIFDRPIPLEFASRDDALSFLRESGLGGRGRAPWVLETRFVQDGDGRLVWRADVAGTARWAAAGGEPLLLELWSEVGRLRCPTLVVRGERVDRVPRRRARQDGCAQLARLDGRDRRRGTRDSLRAARGVRRGRPGLPRRRMTTGPGERPLEGTVVLDLTIALAGPYATLLLAGLGATVIKIENPRRGGDHARANAPYVGPAGFSLARAHDEDVSAAMLERSRNKLGVTLDLKSERGKGLFGDLVQRADAVVENYAAGTADRLGIGYTFCSSRNDRIVYTAISGFGASQPGRKGMDTIFQAMSGLMTVSGDEGDPPVRIGVPFGDMTGPLFAVIGTLAALTMRERTGLGQFVDVSLVGALTSLVATEPFDKLAELGVPTRTGNTVPRLAPFGIFPTRDGDVAICAPTDEMAQAVLSAIGQPTLARDPRYATRDQRVVNWVELHRIIGEWTSGRTTAETLAALERAGAPAAAVRSPAEAVRDPERLAQGDTAQLVHPTLGPVDDLYGSGLPIRFSEASAGYDRPPPSLGEHNAFVFGGILGLSDDDLDRLRDDGVV